MWNLTEAVSSWCKYAVGNIIKQENSIVWYKIIDIYYSIIYNECFYLCLNLNNYKEEKLSRKLVDKEFILHEGDK